MARWLARLCSSAVLIVALGGVALAADGRGRGRGGGNDDGPPTTPTEAPEIDVSAGINALALLAGGLVVIRGRRQAKRV